MQFNITINCDNAAFKTQDDRTEEIKRILLEVARKLEAERTGTLRDYNGNKVGSWGFSK